MRWNLFPLSFLLPLLGLSVGLDCMRTQSTVFPCGWDLGTLSGYLSFFHFFRILSLAPLHNGVLSRPKIFCGLNVLFFGCSERLPRMFYPGVSFYFYCSLFFLMIAPPSEKVFLVLFFLEVVAEVGVLTM